MNTTPTDAIVYIGTYTRTEPHVQGKAAGIYVYQLDRTSGALTYLSTAGGVVNPSFLTIDSQRRYLYAVQEVEAYQGQPGGVVSAFAIDPHTHALELLNHQPTHGAHPCYASIDSTGRWLLVANYGGGSVSVLPIADDGALGPTTAVVQHHGQPTHHDGPHPHSIVQTPDDRYVLVPDCGLDRIYIYRLDTENGTLTANEPPWVGLRPGAGPRHLAFSPSGTYLYCINERNSTVSAFAYTAEQDVLRELQTVSTLPEGFVGRNACADIHLDRSGRTLYGSNRGHDSIAIFGVDAGTGQLHARGHTLTGGRTPRNFGIDSAGNLLLAANQDTDTVVAFTLDQTTGELRASGAVAVIASPVCVVILP